MEGHCLNPCLVGQSGWVGLSDKRLGGVIMNEDTFLKKNYEYYQAWHHWLSKAEKLKRASLVPRLAIPR